MIWNEAVRLALQIGNLAPRGADSNPELIADGQIAFTQLLSEWSRDGILGPYFEQLDATLTPGVNEYTAGTGGDFSKRPITLTQAIVSGGTLGLSRIPIPILSWDTFQFQTFPTAQSLPGYIALNNTFPLGTIAMYPTPQAAYTLTIVGTFPWDAIDFNTEMEVPPGYDSAIIDNAAVRCLQNYTRAIPPYLMSRAMHQKTGIVMGLQVQDKAKNNKWADVYRSTGIRNWQTDTPVRVS